MTTVLVKMEHVRAAKMCSSGTRDFFKRHNLDWNKFITVGLPCEVLEATGDELALSVVRIAKNG